MAVYFQPQYKPWWADLANTALKEGLSGLMKGMFERDAYARQKNRSNKEWAQVFGPPAQQVAAQEATQQPAAMTVESSPDTTRLSSAITGATQTSPFGSDAIGFAQTAPKVNVPKQFLPTANDGLLGTSQKAVMANNYAKIAMLTTEKDDCRTVAEMVRFNCKAFPTPTPLYYFARQPFFLDREAMKAIIAQMKASEEYKDIHECTAAINGEPYLFSIDLMSEKYARALANGAEAQEGDE